MLNQLQQPGRFTAAERRALAWLLGILFIQLFCQLSLMVDRLALFRVFFRSATFLVSILALVFVQRGRSDNHPCKIYAFGIFAILGLSLFHQATNSLLAGAVQILLYLAIIGPLFWTTCMEISPRVFSTYIVAIWGWYSLSAFVAVLQVYFPGYFQPAVSSVVLGLGEMADGLKIQMADGTFVWRPMGLTDSPGGAAAAGIYSFLFGLGLLVNTRNPTLRILALTGLFIGLFCVYLCQVRSMLVMAGVAAISFTALLGMRGQFGKMISLGFAIPAAFVFSFIWAQAKGGESVTNRYETLVADDASKVYYNNRGKFFEDTWDVLIPKYPLGAGLGRWGMTRSYFGNEANRDSPPLWVEIQLTGWIFDGGILLALLYYAAILTAMGTMLRIVWRSNRIWISTWAGMIFGYDLSALALTFSYPLFIGQGGMEFWLLNSATYAASKYSPDQKPVPRRRVPATFGMRRNPQHLPPSVPASKLLPESTSQ